MPRNKKFEVRVNYRCEEVPRDEFDHAVLCITLRDGSKYAWDLSAAQYGWTEVISPWCQYEQEKIFYISKIEEHGTTKKRMMSITTPKLDVLHMKQSNSLAQKIMQMLVRFVEDVRIGDMTTLLKKDHAKFETYNVWIINMINLCMDDMFKDAKTVCVLSTDK